MLFGCDKVNMEWKEGRQSTGSQDCPLSSHWLGLVVSFGKGRGKLDVQLCVVWHP